MTTFTSAQEIMGAKGAVLGPTDWLPISQERINEFASATNDAQFIHTDPERAAKTPFGTTIAHGFLTLSLTSYFMTQLLDIPSARMVVNYGLNKVRFVSPVPVNAKVRAEGVLVDAKPVDAGGVQLTVAVTIGLEGSDKPACVAECLVRVYL